MVTAGLRAAEFGYLDERAQVYLDHAGAGLPPRSLVRAHAGRVAQECFGNPHSQNPTSGRSGALLAEARSAVLRHFGADSAEYAAVFTANATGALRLVGEAYPFSSGGRLVLPMDNHNSVNGLREYARASGTAVEYVPLGPDLRVSPERMVRALCPVRPGTGLLAFPAQSNFSGVRHPLEWVEEARQRGYDTLLDAAAFVPANRLDLSRVRPDFIAVSWYKVFGYPTGIGCLVARRTALARLRRPWFAGGTIRIASARAGWHEMADGEAAFEDGTVNFLSVPDVTAGLRWIDAIGMDAVHTHVSTLTGRLLAGLGALRHSDGSALVRLYGPASCDRRGGTVALNLLDVRGRVVDERVVARDGGRQGISLRTGCFCNPGAVEAAFSLDVPLLRSLARRHARTIEEYLDGLGLASAGAVRVSVGIASNAADVDAFLAFVEETYRDREPDVEGLAPRDGC
ncbi:aminotransferase class V-fold PLP-dependent enzyme [Streptomyces sp. L-9-10]|uniref:aminotransferase class V-fold PLP-dependent enzyme n=1 Tax=Streptomyces sp. L-9-10 TaxID=1478131 RepID=UPI00101CE7C7|nr:aminotransferase class V-fold PLP-dependent enzyme [Streptomyces sp. L-9-10]